MDEDVCAQCGKPLGYLPYVCRYCGKSFCVEHRLPESHGCEGLEKWKRGELKEFKKPIKKLKTEKPFLEPHDWMPKPTNRSKLTIFLIIITVLFLVLLLKILK